jgi:hypothetical protein
MDDNGSSSSLQEHGDNRRRALMSHRNRVQDGGGSDTEAAANAPNQVRVTQMRRTAASVDHQSAVGGELGRCFGLQSAISDQHSAAFHP